MTDPSATSESPGKARGTRLLVTLHLVAFLMVWMWRAGGFAWVNAAYGLVPARLSADPVGESTKLLTGLFIHDGLAHLVWNLIFLLLFGRKIEHTLGYGKYLVFFLVTGVFSSLCQFTVDPTSPIPIVGSSGAIAGLLGGFLVLFPKRRVTIFGWPAYGVIGLWFVLNLIGGVASVAGAASDTAFFAHLGGFASGLILIKLFAFSGKEDGHVSGYSGGGHARVIKQPIFPRDADGPFWRT